MQFYLHSHENSHRNSLQISRPRRSRMRPSSLRFICEFVCWKYYSVVIQLKSKWTWVSKCWKLHPAVPVEKKYYIKSKILIYHMTWKILAVCMNFWFVLVNLLSKFLDVIWNATCCNNNDKSSEIYVFSSINIWMTFRGTWAWQ